MTVTITNVMAMSIDAMIGKHALESDAARRTYNFTNADDRDFVRDQLRHADAVITGANSLRASGSTWLEVNDRNQFPAWIVFSTRGLSENLEFWSQTQVRRIVVSPSPVQEEHCKACGVENWCYSEDNLPDFISRLEREGLSRILLFGGGSINKIFYQHGLVDFAKITLCPLIIGSIDAPRFINPGLTSPIHFEGLSSVQRGDLVFLSYKVKK